MAGRPVVRRAVGTRGRGRTCTGAEPEAGAVDALTGDVTPRRSANANGRGADRADGECPAAGERTIVRSSRVILNSRADEADRTPAGR
ncbi:hypothetical protein ACFWBB_38030 [Streptomyces sp. NPDC060000]|uniref:hypothetical protein n=1 Tax=Streptomyces sp. NPDC060000 TaxID=3347031 RepID=UPI0036C84409